MNRTISFILVACGAVLIIYGVSASNSLGSDFSRMFTGSPTDRTIWLLLGGIVAVLVGAGGLLRGPKSS